MNNQCVDLYPPLVRLWDALSDHKRESMGYDLRQQVERQTAEFLVAVLVDLGRPLRDAMSDLDEEDDE